MQTDVLFIQFICACVISTKKKKKKRVRRNHRTYGIRISVLL